MKEILAIIRPGKDRSTKDALAKIGVPICTTQRVFGRGKQKGLKYRTPGSHGAAEAVVMRYLPKKMLYLVVSDSQARLVVRTLIRANQTGHFGDGKIFVMDAGEAVRIRTNEKGEEALQ